jgi:hypothetical protein
MTLGVEIKGLDRLKRKINAMPKILNDAVNDATYEITELVRSAAELRLASSMKFSSGELIGSLKTEVVENAEGKIVGRVWSDKAQAIYREFGTGPNGQASSKDLPEGVNPVYTQTHWFIPAEEVGIDLNEIYGMPKITIQGKEFYITSGQPARPFLYPSLKEILPQMPEIYKEHVQKKLRELK